MIEFEQYMHRCLQLAEMGLGKVAPNPMVGCVIIHENKIIGEGFHQKYGEAHAEVNAIANVKDKLLLPESTVYVSLEPCSHYGKTPPCSDLLIKYKVKRVVVACLDVNPLVAGKGIEKMRTAGIEVITGVLEKEAKQLNKRFFTFYEKKRPYIILKWAKTKDGFIAKAPPFTRENNWITNDASNKISHAWRAQEQAILVGTNTALLDNPKLTTRLSEGKSPLRLLIDKDLKVPRSNHIFSDEAETIVFTQKKGVLKSNISYELIDFEKDITPQILNVLFERKITSVIVEGGTHTLQAFIDKGLWDEARIFTGNKNFNDGLKSPVINGTLISKEVIDSDLLETFIR